MNEFIGKWRQFIVEEVTDQRVKFEIGDTVVMKGDELKGKELTIIDKRTMFGSNLQAFTVQDENGMGRSEYDETQLVKIGGVEDRATRADKMMSGEFEDEYLDDKDNPVYDDVRGDLDADDVLDGILNEGKKSGGILLRENAPGYNTRKFGHPLPTLESVQAAHEAKKDEEDEVRDGVRSAAEKLGMKPSHIKEDSFSGAEIDPNVELYSNDAVDWDFEESIKKIIDELKEYQNVNPQDDLQTAINHLEYLIYT